MGDKSVLIMPGEVTGAQAEVMRQAFGRSTTTRRSGSGRKRKRRSAAGRPRKRARTKSKRTSGRGGAKRFVKGSAAAKRHMARLRKMRRK